LLGGKITASKHPEILERGRNIVLSKLRGKFRNYSLDIPLSKELCEFIGAFIGDGYTNKYNKRYLVELTGDKNLDIDYFTNILAKNICSILGINWSSTNHTNKNALRVFFHSKLLFKLLTERFKFPVGKKCYTVKIPEEILTAEEKFLYATIRGIFDTDGCVFFCQRKIYKKPYPRVTLQIASEPLYLQLSKFLAKEFSLYCYANRGKRKYVIDIYGHAQLEKWINLIGFSNKRHLDRIKEFRN